MTIKYFLLSFLAIQAVNGGVMKKVSSEDAFIDLIVHVEAHTLVANVMHDKLENRYADRSSNVRENAQNISLVAEIVFTQVEEFFKANAQWTVMCFDGVQDQLAQAKQNLVKNNEKCIKDTQVTVDKFLEESVYYGNGAKNLADYLKGKWSSCNKEEACQDEVYYKGRDHMNAFSAEFMVYRRNIDAFIYLGFEELTTCLHTYYQKDYFETLLGIGKDIQKCLTQ